MSDMLAPPAQDPIIPQPRARRPGTVLVIAVVGGLAVIALTVVGVAALRSKNSPGVVGNMMGRSDAGSHDMPYGIGGPMMGGGSMMGGNDGATSAPVAGARVIAITAAADAFTPDEIRVTAGETVNIALTAVGSPQDFTVNALGVQVAATAGRTVRGALRAPMTPGTYPFYCSVPGHRQAGMTGVLIVEPAR